MKIKKGALLFYAWALLCFAAYIFLFVIPKLQGRFE